MYSGLLIILLPLIAGYLIPVKHPAGLQLINLLLGGMVYIILFLMGIGLAFLDNLSTNLLTISRMALVSATAILSCNLLALSVLEKFCPWAQAARQEKIPSRLATIMETLKLPGVVIAGFLCGISHWSPLRYASHISESALLFLLLLVGLQLRGNGMTLRQIVLNRRGMLIAAVVCLSAFAGGALTTLLLNLPLKTALALASGYGWYSLSGILITDAFGPVTGSAAFFNDLLRELLAIMLIPALMPKNRSAALGLCGATSMDFTLPVLHRTGGIDIVPAAVVHGFILSLAAPVLMALFST